MVFVSSERVYKCDFLLVINSNLGPSKKKIWTDGQRGSALPAISYFIIRNQFFMFVNKVCFITLMQFIRPTR